MAMSSLNISLPEQLKNYVESQVEQGDYGTPSEYVRELIRRDKERRRERLETGLVEALRSGDVKLRPRDLKNASLVTLLRKKAGEGNGKKSKPIR
jgi:antitoxin ParD1/3/4